MAPRLDSYGDVPSVQTLTRHLLDGHASFNDTTRPTLAEVEAMLDRWSAVLNVALMAAGVTTPLSDEVARLAAAQWVIRQTAAEVELTQRGTGYSDEEGSRTAGLRMTDATMMAAQLAAALRAGDGATGKASAGLTYTGLLPVAERAAYDAIYERPLFRRGLFDA